MNIDSLLHEVFLMANEVPSNPNAYVSGILLNDDKIKDHMTTLAHMQAIIMQSLQVNNKKRAMKYIMAFHVLSRRNVLIEENLTESITSKLVENV